MQTKINEEQSGDKCDTKYEFGALAALSTLQLVFLIFILLLSQRK